MVKVLSPHRPGAITRASDVLALIDAWHQSLELQVASGDLASETAYTYKTGLRKLREWVDAHGHVSEALVRSWVADLRTAYEPATVATWFAGVRHFFAWGKREGRLPYDPTEGLKRARRKGTGRRHKRDPLTDREVLRLLALPDDSLAGNRNKAILALMAYTGARTIEVHRANLADLKTEKGHLVLSVQGKGREASDEILVLAHREAETALRDWLAGRGDKPGPLFVSLSNRSLGHRLSRSSIRRLVKYYFKSAGVHGDKKTTHSLRHTAITNAIRHGAPVQKVQTMARHANIATTMIYFHEVDRIENPAEQFIDYGGGQ